MRYFGIDISKDVFDVVDSEGVHFQFENSFKGFRSFLKMLKEDSHCVMEATGYYHYRLAYYLLEKGVRVSVENPLSVKRFIQMKLSKVKTDKADAKMICEYAKSVEPKLWQGQTKNQIECLQIIRLLSLYTKQNTALKNKIHGEKTLGKPSKIVLKSLQKSLKDLKQQMTVLESELLCIVKTEHQELLTRLQTIPGLGKKTAIILIVMTDGFKRFETAGQLCSYAGLTPIIRQSGSSVRGQARISKVGNQKLRNMLFLCSFTAHRHNKACKAIYDRICSKGKSKKLALMAVCNKLLKQAFAIAQSGLDYDENFRSVQPEMN